MDQIKTYYEILDLPEDASNEDIKLAYRSHVKEWHPDLHPEKANAAEMTQAINEAYSVLSDPNKRIKYDEYLSFIRVKSNPVQDEAAAPATEESKTSPSPETDKTDYSNMSFKEYVENVANESYTTYQDVFNGKIHKFDENGYREYVKNKGTVFDKKIDDQVGAGALIGFAVMMICSVIYGNSNKSPSPALMLISMVACAFGIVSEIHKRNKAAKAKRDEKLGGNDSIIEADRWFEVWLYPEMPLSECKKAFFTFSVRVDKHILSRFNKMSIKDKEKYADIIELLKESIKFRETHWK